ncbi:S9 family peptidase [Kordiimonas pumila]|uniref:S9 family peptidase n=1 Tax=Kordiimonas pumila TaxID=2161677 RepID=A0ABV7D6P5_9PROT|nr:S9 family peptidase [Kordiimonas pumila]
MRKKNNPISNLLALSVFLASYAVQADTTPVINPDDILALKVPLNPALSPDGKWIAYQVRTNDMEKDKRTNQLWITSSDGKTSLPMTANDYSANTPRWSPDGTWLAFMAAKGGDDATDQVWVLDMRGGEAQQYTNVKQGVSDFSWAPDSTKMLLIVQDMSDAEKEQLENPDEEEKPRPWVIDRLQFKEDYVGYLDRTRTHIYIQNGMMAPAEQVTFGDYDDSEALWSPDGSEIAFVSNRTEEPDSNTNSDIWVVSATPSGAPAELRQITSNPGADHSPAWSHDGKTIAHVSVTAVNKIWYATNHLAITPATGGELQILTAGLDRNINSPAFTQDDKGIVFSLEDSAEQQLASLTLKSGKINRLVKGDLAISSFDYNTKNGTALLISKPDLPDEVFFYKNNTLKQVTNLNKNLLANKPLASVKNITFPSSDGTEIEGFIFLPPSYEAGKKYPTLLRIHGGPVSQYDFSFNYEAQLLAAQGYVVVISNPRGSSGYGEDFSAVLLADWGNKDFEDVNAAIDYAIKEGYTDPDKMGVGGWSYGGILTNYVITKTGRFKGAISGASEVNHTANYGHDIYQALWEAELGLPWENKDAWERINPFNNLGHITTPTLVMGGKEDWNVPILNSEQLYQALKRIGVPTQLVVYPGESHGFTRPSFIKDKYERYIDWYNKYVKGGE